ncbi:MAG: hypothetical protein HKN57_03090 [Xanthomonadales bacterium]|nr:hypothetical protein [Gammaproteobacteria bacterium]MBT8053136.1 hypothetical protein [Gammaproteobacteria bacterium]NND56212.1 hypothetical protein [Xanthomonadales bacterium]NNK52287.1 hypothetical protein [Xanthomonadales bacterium]
MNKGPALQRKSEQAVVRILALLSLLAAMAISDVRADTPLFESHNILKIAIPLDFATLCRPRESDDCDYTPTVLEFVDEHGDQQSLPIEIRIRGGWRSLTKNCSAPLLFIQFDEQTTEGTPFAGQSLLPLTTHCGRGLSLTASRDRQLPSVWERYLLREYLAHRLYNVITPVSLNARLVRITYPNPDKPSRKIENYAFFSEHFESVAARNGFTLLERGSFDPEKLDRDAAVIVALFEFMIGNTDFSILRERNIVLLQDSTGAQFPLPYDFDMSGLVDAEYAGPAPDLPIDDVRDRYYLGYCLSATGMGLLTTHYLEKQSQLVSVVKSVPGLEKKNLRSALRYLDAFFDILESDDLRERQIIEDCQPWPPGTIGQTNEVEG